MSILTNTSEVSQSASEPGMSRQNRIPLAVRGMLSPNSNADECFINQGFSSRLQAYLVGYVTEVTSQYGILAE